MSTDCVFIFGQRFFPWTVFRPGLKISKEKRPYLTIFFDLQEALLHAKARHFILCCLVLMTAASAQSPYSNSDLDTLVGPIALYPDPLLTNTIKAATFPDQVIEASQSNSVSDSWDDSVKALDSYPDVLTMMAGNATWMKSLGWAATNQLADTMDAVQRFRYRAQQAGNLSTDKQVQVITEGTTIRIEPANPQVIYVPTYNPVYVDNNNFGNAFVYGAAIATSAYLWSNIYHWNNNCFYAHPYGWRPPAAYYRPYGWQNGGIYGGTAVRLNGNNVVRGPVTINNVNVNRNNINNVNRTNVNNVNRTNVNTANRTNINNVNRTNVNTVNRANVNTANRVNAQPRTSVSRTNYSAKQTNRSVNSSPGLGSYSSSGATMRESNRGASSRRATSVSSGARMGGGAARGGRRR